MSNVKNQIATIENLSTVVANDATTLKQLVEIYNTHVVIIGGVTVNKFKDKSTARQRCESVLYIAKNKLSKSEADAEMQVEAKVVIAEEKPTPKLYMAYNHNGTELLAKPLPLSEAKAEAITYSKQTGNKSTVSEAKTEAEKLADENAVIERLQADIKSTTDKLIETRNKAIKAEIKSAALCKPSTKVEVAQDAIKTAHKTKQMPNVDVSELSRQPDTTKGTGYKGINWAPRDGFFLVYGNNPTCKGRKYLGITKELQEAISMQDDFFALAADIAQEK